MSPSPGPGPAGLPVLSERRQRLVEAAVQVLAEDGPHGLSLRRIAALAGSSTQEVYTLFGGKAGLAEALYTEGFRRMSITITSALATAPPPGDPGRLIALGRAYRQFALKERAFFSVMFGRSIPGFSPPSETRAARRAETLGHVVRAADECLFAGTLIAKDAIHIARTCWVTMHGLCSLEVAGLLSIDDEDAFADAVIQGIVDQFTPPGQPG